MYFQSKRFLEPIYKTLQKSTTPEKSRADPPIGTRDARPGSFSFIFFCEANIFSDHVTQRVQLHLCDPKHLLNFQKLAKFHKCCRCFAICCRMSSVEYGLKNALNRVEKFLQRLRGEPGG